MMRYEVRSTGYPERNEKMVVGWSDDLDMAKIIASLIRAEEPRNQNVSIFDYQRECVVVRYA